MRGLSVTPDGVVWVSGGHDVASTRDPRQGLTLASSVEAKVELDLRDLHGIDGQTVVAMAAGPGERSRLYRTVDGGKNWQLVHQNLAPEGFYNAMAFAKSGWGVVVGDPVGGHFELLASHNGGETFHQLPTTSRPVARPGEHMFAASGTCLALQGNNLLLGTGGTHTRVLHSPDRGQSWEGQPVPLATGSDSAGVFSLAFVDPNIGIAVGGDYEAPEETRGTAAWTEDGGQTWHRPTGSLPSGYRSAVAFGPRENDANPVAIAVGTNGSDLSQDGGKHWRRIEAPPLHAVAVLADGRHAVGVGPEGRFVELTW